MTRIVNVRATDRYDVFVGRPSKWGNPFPISHRTTREQVIEMYETYIRRRPDLLDDLPELAGKVLGCCCAPLSCHADVLVKLLKERGLE